MSINNDITSKFMDSSKISTDDIYLNTDLNSHYNHQIQNTLNTLQIKSTDSVDLNTNYSLKSDLYLWIFIAIGICFALGAYYFYNLVKKFLYKISKNPEDETKVEHSKNEVFKNLSIFCFIRSISCLVIFVFANKHGDNASSFICYISQIFPELILFSILLFHVSFLIEKYYQIKFRKTDIFFTPSLEVLNILVYIIFSLFILACVLKEKFLTFMYLCEGISALVSAILCILYLYYGLSLASFYSIKKSISSELKEKKFIHNRLFSISLLFGLIYLCKSILSFLVCLDVFGDLNPSFINPNIWDCTKIILFEVTSIIILGNTKQRHEGFESTKKSFMEFNEKEAFFDNKNIDLHRKEMEQILQDLNEPLLA